MRRLNDAGEDNKHGIPRLAGERRAVRQKNPRELDGLESVPRLLFLWNRCPRIAAANPQHHVGRRETVATMVLMAYLLGYAGFSTALPSGPFNETSTIAGERFARDREDWRHFAVGDKRSVISVVFLGRTTTRLDQSEKRLCE